VTNLLTNAFRYGRGAPVHVRLALDGARACVTVGDSGPGVAPEDRERIFEQFERGAAASSVPGLGLGLYISRQIAEAHHGSLAVHADVAPGAAFTLCLPAAT
jgi:signal transduction histidine kinase